jgi:GntR family transcriptional regulator
MPRPAARSRRIAAAIEWCIAAGEWLPGELLPSRAELGRRFGVHEQTVRLALVLLRDRGLIESRGERLRPEVAHTPIVRTFTEPDAPWLWSSETTPRGTTTASEETAQRLDLNPGVRLHWETEERADVTGRSSMHVTTWWRDRRRPHAAYRAHVDAVFIDADQAAALRLPVDTVALRVVRTRLDEAGNPVETSDLVLPRDRWRIEVR